MRRSVKFPDSNTWTTLHSCTRRKRLRFSLNYYACHTLYPYRVGAAFPWISSTNSTTSSLTLIYKLKNKPVVTRFHATSSIETIAGHITRPIPFRYTMFAFVSKGPQAHGQWLLTDIEYDFKSIYDVRIHYNSAY